MTLRFPLSFDKPAIHRLVEITVLDTLSQLGLAYDTSEIQTIRNGSEVRFELVVKLPDFAIEPTQKTE